MTPSFFSQLFLIFFFLWISLQLLLSFRQSRAVIRHYQEVPKDFQGTVSLEEHQLAAKYTLSKQRLARWGFLWEGLIILMFTFGGGLNLIDQLSIVSSSNPLSQGVILIVFFTLINAILTLPIQLYSTFKLEASFGFNRTTVKTFFLDRIKGLLLGAIIGIPLLYLAIYLMGTTGTLWWLYVWIVWLGFSLLLMWAYPKWIAPIFNKFEPLEEGELKSKIENLLERTGFKSNGIFIMDGSKRSGHGNAYFTGLGANKRIVFFDTLIKNTEPHEIEAVLAHELGHFKNHHIIKQMVITFILALITLFILGQLMPSLSFYWGLGVLRPSHAMALLLFLLILPIFTFPFSPISSLLSRKNEFEADEFASKTASADSLISALTKLYRKNASSLVSDQWYERFYSSHPSASERIYALKQLRNKPE